MLLTPDLDTERRRNVWARFAEPLFDFVFDEGTLEADYRRIGRAAFELGYTNEELAAIYWNEVFPAIAGSWIAVDPLDPDWLKNRIQHRPNIGFALTLVLRPWWVWVGWDCWREIKKGIEFARNNGKND